MNIFESSGTATSNQQNVKFFGKKYKALLQLISRNEDKLLQS